MTEPEASLSAVRKDDHVRLALEQASSRFSQNDFDDISFMHHALDAIDIDKVSTATKLFGKQLTAPVYINAMTGGTAKTAKINADLARVAAETGIAVASGSMSPIFKDKETANSFKILRDLNPNGIVLANVNANATLEQTDHVIDLLEADALQIHINSVQELTMQEGDRTFNHWVENIANIVESLTVPVVVKEVGFGLSARTALKLHSVGVQYIDVAGKGGTNFALIEQSRSGQKQMSELSDWGLSTVKCLLDISALQTLSGTNVLASGGVRNALDLAKCLALGAQAVGVAGGFLHTLQNQGAEALIDEVEQWKKDLTVVQSLLGIDAVNKFDQAELLIYGKVAEFCAMRDIDTKTFALKMREESITDV